MSGFSESATSTTCVCLRFRRIGTFVPCTDWFPRPEGFQLSLTFANTLQQCVLWGCWFSLACKSLWDRADFFQRWLWRFVISDVNVPFSTLLPVTHCTASVSHYKVLIHRGLWPSLSGGWEMLSWQWDVNIVGQIFSWDKNPAWSLWLKGRLLIHVENSWPRRDHKVQCPWASATLCSQDQNVFLPRIPFNFNFSKSPLNCFMLKPTVLSKKIERNTLCVVPFSFTKLLNFHAGRNVEPQKFTWLLCSWAVLILCRAWALAWVFSPKQPSRALFGYP